MSAMQRRKGASAERELFRLLSDELGTVVRRNVDQARKGGADGLEVDGWAIEVKRHESGFRAEWWAQAVAQATSTDRWPALAYRASRQPWRVRVWLSSCCADSLAEAAAVVDAWVEVDLQTFALIVRESLHATERTRDERQAA